MNNIAGITIFMFWYKFIKRLYYCHVLFKRSLNVILSVSSINFFREPTFI